MPKAGTLYIVGTPIGNLSEITPRAEETLKNADIIAAEDTRTSSVLLSALGISRPLMSYHKFNERSRSDELIQLLLDGKSIALISDAGMPCISDPGAAAVSAAVEAGINVVGISGPCAAVLSVAVSGFDTDSFTFWGFLPREGKKRRDAIDAIKNCTSRTAVIYESPHRVQDTVRELEEYIPGADYCICNDLTKKFERIYRGNAADVLGELRANPNAEKGEYAIVMCLPPPEEETLPNDMPLEAMLLGELMNCGLDTKAAVKNVTEKTQLPKKEVYAAMLRLKEIAEKLSE